MLQKVIHLYCKKFQREVQNESMYTAMTTLRNRIMQLFLSFDRLINLWLSLVTISRSLMIKGERKRKKKKRKRKLVACVHRIEAIRLLKLRWTIDRERTTFIQIYGGFTSTPDYECTFRRNSSVFASHIEIFSIELAGWIEGTQLELIMVKYTNVLRKSLW